MKKIVVKKKKVERDGKGGIKKVREIKPGRKADYESESVNDAISLLEKRGVIEKIESKEKDGKEYKRVIKKIIQNQYF